MATGSSIGTRNAARTAIIVIDDIEFSGETARRWKHAIVTAAKNVPTIVYLRKIRVGGLERD